MVTLSPTIPVSLAGSRRKSLTAAGVVLSIWKVTTLLGPRPPCWGTLDLGRRGGDLKVPLVTGLPVESVKSWNAKLNGAVGVDVRGRQGERCIVLAPPGAFGPGLGDRDGGPDDGRAGELGVGVLGHRDPVDGRMAAWRASARVGAGGGVVGGGATMSVAWSVNESVTGLLFDPASSVA